MFLRATIRKKDGKEHRYWSVVENRRLAGGRVVQRHVLYLGEINSSQELAWRKSIEVLEDGSRAARSLALFPEDRCEGLGEDASVVRLRLSELSVRRPRQWGACWLALMLWQELGLDGLVESVWVSIDAARPETYAIVRRGGSFGKLLQNFEFLGALRREGHVRHLRLDFVVQARNFREMSDAVDIARAFGFDRIHFQMIRNWGTFTVAEFDRRFIGSPDHPDYGEFLEVLRHPNLAWAGVDWSNVRQLYDRAKAEQQPSSDPKCHSIDAVQPVGAL